jgi:hypothetical protein
MAAREDAVELTMDPASLYREEVFTDRKAGVIRVMTPLKADGSFDTGRRILYVGEAQILTPGGVLPLAFEIAAATLGEAVARFGEQAKAAVQQALDEVQELRRQAASSLVVADRMPGGAGLPGSRLIRP